MFKCFFISKHLDLDQIAHSIISDLYRTKMYPNKGDCVCLDLETNVVRLSLNFVCNAPCYTGMQYFLYNKAWIYLWTFCSSEFYNNDWRITKNTLEFRVVKKNLTFSGLFLDMAEVPKLNTNTKLIQQN